MADIELVIKITEEEYKHIMGMQFCGTRSGKGLLNKILYAIRTGTPLPKGHGNLKDEDELEECKEIMNTISGESKYAVRMDDIRNMPTIIEADKRDKHERKTDEEGVEKEN